MKRLYVKYLAAPFIAAAVGIACASFALAAEPPASVKVETMGRYATAKGDADKFRALNWIRDGYVWGISDMSIEQKLKDGREFYFEGRVIPSEKDYNLDMVYRKEDKFFARIKYKSYRKYYDNTGGVYDLWGGPEKVTTIQDGQALTMDMEDFFVETGIGYINDPDLALSYERMKKTGAKSMLNWTPVTDGRITRYIGPSWMRVDNASDIFTVRGKKEVCGILLRGQQKIEVDNNISKQYKKFINNQGLDSANNLIRTESEESDVKVYRTNIRGEKWIMNDRTFLTAGYNYQHVNSHIIDQLQEFSQRGRIFNYASPRQSLPSPGRAREDEHVWTGHAQTELTKDFTVISKLKFESQEIRSRFEYLQDTSVVVGQPDGKTDRRDEFRMRESNSKAGENFSLRYTGIPRTSVYTEMDFEQTRDWLIWDFDSMRVGSTSVAPSAPYNLDRVKNGDRTSWAIGGRTVPLRNITLTAQVGQHYENNHYKIVRVWGNPNPLFNGFKQNSDEVTTRLSWRPLRWIQNSFRYQYQNSRVRVRTVRQIDQNAWPDNLMYGNTYTYDVTLIPTQELLMTLAYSWQNFHVAPYSSYMTPPNPPLLVPAFDSGVNSIIFSSSYTPRSNINILNSVYYSKADNVNNLMNTGLSLGSGFQEVTFTTGVEWTPKKGVTIKPAYSYNTYQGNPLVEESKYQAHIIMISMGLEW